MTNLRLTVPKIHEETMEMVEKIKNNLYGRIGSGEISPELGTSVGYLWGHSPEMILLYEESRKLTIQRVQADKAFREWERAVVDLAGVPLLYMGEYQTVLENKDADAVKLMAVDEAVRTVYAAYFIVQRHLERYVRVFGPEAWNPKKIEKRNRGVIYGEFRKKIAQKEKEYLDGQGFTCDRGGIQY